MPLGMPSRLPTPNPAGGSSSGFPIVAMLQVLSMLGSAAQGVSGYKNAKDQAKEEEKRRKAMQGGDFNARPVQAGEGNYLQESDLIRFLMRR